MHKSNSTTPPSVPSRPRYRHPSRMYYNARQLQLTMETESPEMQRLLISRLFAMAEYLFSTPAGCVLAERMYIALSDAWQSNRDTYGDTPKNRWDRVTVECHKAILHAINFADGNVEDSELEEELAAMKGKQKEGVRLTPSAVVNIDDWKRYHSGQSYAHDEL